MSPQELDDHLRAGLKQAMRDRDQPAVRAIRRLIGAIGNAGAVPIPGIAPPQAINPGNPVLPPSTDRPRAELTPDDLARVLAAELEDIDSAIAEYESRGHAEQAARLRDEKRVIERYC